MGCRGHNLIAQSQSGTGKTIAFVIGMLFRIDVAEEFPQVRYALTCCCCIAFQSRFFPWPPECIGRGLDVFTYYSQKQGEKEDLDRRPARAAGKEIVYP